MNLAPEGLIHAKLLDGHGGASELAWDEISDWMPDQGNLWIHFDIEKAGVENWLSEHSGLSKESLALCDDFVTIPMYGFTTSYNVSTAMAILLQHFGENYRASGKDIFISQEYKDQLRQQWYERDIRKKFGWS